MERIFKQETVVTSPLSEQLMMKGFKSQLSSAIFKELINGEKFGLKVTFTVDVIEQEDKYE